MTRTKELLFGIAKKQVRKNMSLRDIAGFAAFRCRFALRRFSKCDEPGKNRYRTGTKFQ
jgi:hypothetical protein